MVNIYVADMQMSDEAYIASKLNASSLEAQVLSNQKTVCCTVSDAEEVMQVIHNAGLTPTI